QFLRKLGHDHPGLATDGERLFVADSGNARVLVWQRLPEAPNRGADLALGQRDLRSAILAGTDTKATLRGPEGVAVAGGSLFVADVRSRRILIWRALPQRSGEPADRVLSGYAAVAVDYDPHAKTLAAADIENHRVLLWHGLDPATMSDNQSYQVALTQVTDDPAVEHTARLLDRPRGVRLADGKLLVSDGNGRLLIWNQVPATATASADVVLGRPDLSEIDRPDEVKRDPTREVISGFPAGLAMGAGRLFAVDQRANRVLIWNGIPKEHGAKADGVFGQRRMNLGAPNERGFSAESLFLFDEAHAKKVGFSASGSSNVAAGLALSARHLWISDVHNSRLVRVPVVGEGDGLSGEGIAVRLAIEAGDGQTGVVMTELPQELRVRVLDAFQKPVAGVFASFVAREGGGVVTTASALSDSLGRVATKLRLGQTAGMNRVEALAPGTGLAPVTLQATALPGPAAKIVVASGDQQKGTVNLPLQEPLVVRATDAYGNGVTDVRLQFAATPSSASLSSSEARTGTQGEASVSLTLGSTLGTNRVSVSAPDLSGVPPLELTADAAVPGPATRLAFAVSPPPSLKAGEPFSVTVRIEDDAGNLVGLARQVALALLDSGGSGGVLQGDSEVSSTAGVATFAGLSVPNVGEGYYLLASTQALQEAVSKPFEVTPGQVATLAIVEQPGDASAGASFGRQPVIELLDGLGNRVTDGSVTAIRASVVSGGGSLEGDLFAVISGGVAAFSSLRIDRAGTYTLRFGDGPFIESSSFVVAPATPTRLAFLTQLPNATADDTFTANVALTDDFGNRVDLSGPGVTFSLDEGPPGAEISNPSDNPATISGGAATFSFRLKKAGSGYRLKAAASLAAAPVSSFSNRFQVAAGAPHSLHVLTQPGDATAGQVLGIPPVAELQDAYANRRTSDSSSSVRAFVSQGGGTLHGNTEATLRNGLATFAGLWIDKPGSARLRFESSITSVSPVYSESFPVESLGAVAFVLSLPTSVDTGDPISVTVSAVDQDGHTVPTFEDTITFSSTDALASLPDPTTLTAADGGSRTFSVTFATPGAHTLYAAASTSGLSGQASTTVVAPPADHFEVTVSPSTVIANEPLSVTVTARNYLGATVSDFAGTVALSTTDSQADLPAPYDFDPVTDGGVHTFTGVVLHTPGSQTVFANTLPQSSVTGHASVSVLPPQAEDLRIVSQPVDGTADDAFTFTVELVDGAGSRVTSATDQVMLSLATSPPGATLD
ncbi:hypothetical protein ACFL59_13580, partial [Planctomycetota bacterium]